MLFPSHSPDRTTAKSNRMFDLAESDFQTIDNVLGSLSETGVRNLETWEYLGFNISNGNVEQP